MDLIGLYVTSFVALVGLQLCIPECPNGRNEAELNERMWTRSLSLRFFYELSHLLGIVFVIDVVGYLTITAHCICPHILCTCKNRGCTDENE